MLTSSLYLPSKSLIFNQLEFQVSFTFTGNRVVVFLRITTSVCDMLLIKDQMLIKPYQ